mmetsp:Transcript_28979/g.76601  ORF Transcript_28979/g.76601 Transcript_28979/m.76601 type:complete len:222 (-) Transcript_28979:649-1314(-)
MVPTAANKGNEAREAPGDERLGCIRGACTAAAGPLPAPRRLRGRGPVPGRLRAAGLGPAADTGGLVQDPLQEVAEPGLGGQLRGADAPAGAAERERYRADPDHRERCQARRPAGRGRRQGPVRADQVPLRAEEGADAVRPLLPADLRAGQPDPHRPREAGDQAEGAPAEACRPAAGLRADVQAQVHGAEGPAPGFRAGHVSVPPQATDAGGHGGRRRGGPE